MRLRFPAKLNAALANDTMAKEGSMAEQLKCGACGSVFGSKKELQDHAKESHSHPKK